MIIKLAKQESWQTPEDTLAKMRGLIQISLLGYNVSPGNMMDLYICGIPELPKYRWRVSHVLSLLDADYMDVVDQDVLLPFMPDIVTNPDHLFENFGPHKRMELKFDDVSHSTRFYTAPTHEDVEFILDFGRGLVETDTLLVHCHAGISRSTAAASLILLQAYPEKPATVIFERIRRIRPIARPNTLILELGGYILGRQAEIMNAVKVNFSRG